jgi:hypothetical protein
MNRPTLARRGPAALAAITLGALLAVTPASAQPADMVGHWLLNGSPETTAIGPFVNVVSFTADGQMVNVDPNLGTAVGSWEELSPNKYAVTFTGFLAGDGSRYVVNAVATLDPSQDTFTGPFQTIFMDPAGNVTFQFGGSVTAWRQ